MSDNRFKTCGRCRHCILFDELIRCNYEREIIRYDAIDGRPIWSGFRHHCQSQNQNFDCKGWTPRNFIIAYRYKKLINRKEVT